MPDHPQSDLSVVEVRRHLHEMRQMWKSNDPSKPFYSSTKLANTSTRITEFAFAFVRAHHRQRAK